MSGSTRGAPATMEELLALPEADRYELIEGALAPKEAARGEHGAAQFRFGRLLGPYDRRPGGRDPGGWWFATDVLIELTTGQAYRPDVVGWRRERVPARPVGVPLRITPDWVCEIISPSNASNDTVLKMRGYGAARVPHYWLIDPRDETLQVYRWTPDGYLQVLAATRDERVRAEPFEATEIYVGVFFGEDDD